jgi:hypothetical protein
MNKKQMTDLVNAMVRSTQVLLNDLASDQDEPEISEDQARTLVGIQLRKVQKQIIATSVGCDVEDVVVYRMPSAKEKAVIEAATNYAEECIPGTLQAVKSL